LSRFQAWSLHLSNLLVGGTGIVYAWMRYWAVPEDPYAVMNHPWQPDLQHGHVLAAPLLVFACGMIWREHVWNSLCGGIRDRRRSGLFLGLMLVPMIASGYGIQVSEEESWRQAWIGIHLVTSGGWLIAGAVHPFLRRRSVE
jgi:hypothetical protein